MGCLIVLMVWVLCFALVCGRFSPEFGVFGFGFWFAVLLWCLSILVFCVFWLSGVVW